MESLWGIAICFCAPCASFPFLPTFLLFPLPPFLPPSLPSRNHFTCCLVGSRGDWDPCTGLLLPLMHLAFGALTLQIVWTLSIRSAVQCFPHIETGWYSEIWGTKQLELSTLKDEERGVLIGCGGVHQILASVVLWKIFHGFIFDDSLKYNVIFHFCSRLIFYSSDLSSWSTCCHYQGAQRWNTADWSKVT